MELLYYAICSLIIIGLIALFFSYIRIVDDRILNRVKIIFSSILAVVFTVQYMWGDEVIRTTTKLIGGPIDSQFFTFVSLILVWLTICSSLILILYGFFKIHILTFIIKYFVMPCSLLSVIFLQYLIVGICGAEALTYFDIRALFVVIEVALLFAYSFSVLWKSKMVLPDKKQIVIIIFSIIGMLICTMPPYLIKGVFGLANGSYEVKDFTIYHRLALYLSLAIPFAIYFIFRNKSKSVIKFALLFISLGALITFSVHYKFEAFLYPTSLPIHLCHTAMYIVPLCLIFKWDKLFYFTFFINVLGAFLAMTMPNYSNMNLVGEATLVFWVNHMCAFFMPVLLVALKVYKRPRFKQIIYSNIAFTIYFVIILIINAWFSHYGSVDFFFVNSDFIAEKLGLWAENLRNITWSFNVNELTLTFYPLYQFLFWLVYVCASFGMWFVYELGFSMADQHYEIMLKKKYMKQSQMDLIKILNGREESEPMEPNNGDKLILRHFSKRYGNSEVFAVKDANLEVHCGEIFGFLGPNGAGKSTIIKSIVGIQPITDGEIEVCGYDVDKQSVMAKKQIGFVPDHYALYEKLTGREYINYIADLYGVDKTERDERMTKYVTKFELESAIDNQIKTYSHGMKQKITIMSALIHNPKIWILDEPLTGLDPNSIYQVKECMKEHAKAGNIVFFSSHIIDVVEKICDRIAIIKKGNIKCVKTINEIEKDNNLESFYLDIIGTEEYAKENNLNINDLKIGTENTEKHTKQKKKNEKNNKK